MGIVVGFYILTVLPWQVHLYKTFGRVEMTASSTGGMNLAKGNLPLFGDIYISVDVDKGDPYLVKLTEDHHVSFRDEFATSDLLRTLAWESMKADPFKAIRRFVQKSIYFLSPADVYFGDGKVEMGDDGVLKLNAFKPRTSLAGVLNHLFKVFLIPFGILGTVFALRLQNPVHGWAVFALLLITGSAALHGLTFPEFRFRYAIEPLLCVGAAYLLHTSRQAGLLSIKAPSTRVP
jgi:hypothetical protein